MKIFLGILIFCAIVFIRNVSASDEILSILNTAKDLTLQETNALRPLFNELQKQYDYITKALETEGVNDVVPWQKEIWPQSANEDDIDLFGDILKFPNDLPTMEYDTNLPTFEEIIGKVDIHRDDLNAEQLTELEDMQRILKDTLDEAQSKINELTRRALLLESELIKINKPKILTYIYKALSLFFRYSARLRRAAYCVYSHIPQLNESLQNISAGVDCYKYTSKVVLRIQKQTVHTVDTINRNVFDLASIYLKIAQQNSLFGKIVTAIVYLNRISNDIRESYGVAMKGLDDLENELPGAVGKTLHCGTDFADTLPEIVSTAVNVTTCITFVEPKSEQNEVLVDMLEHDFDFGDIN